MEKNIEQLTRREWVLGFVNEINEKLFLKHPEYFTSLENYMEGLKYLERFAERELDALGTNKEEGRITRNLLDFAVAISLSSDSELRAEHECSVCSCCNCDTTNVLELSPEEFEKLPDEIRGFAMAFLDFMEEHFSDEIPSEDEQ